MEDHTEQGMEQGVPEDERPLTRGEVEALLGSVVRQLESRFDAQGAERERALRAREQSLDARDMASRAAAAFKARGLPEELGAVMTFVDEQGLTTAADAIEKAFRDGVQRGVETRLKGDAPAIAPAKPLSEMSDDDYYAAIRRL